MLRLLYRCLLHLHPLPFRQRYDEEMLWIFDQCEGIVERGAIFVDGLISLVRQWLIRPVNWKETVVPAPAVRNADGVPVFQMVESAPPPSSALLNGMLLSMAVFGVLAIVIAHGGPSGELRLPRVAVVPDNIAPEKIPPLPPSDLPLGPIGELVLPEGQPDPSPTTAPVETAGPKRVLALLGTQQIVAAPQPKQSTRRVVPVRKRPARSKTMSASTITRHFFPPPGPATIDEAALAEGQETAMTADTLLVLLDQDADGAISRNEWEAASERIADFLSRADRNQDQKLTLSELREALAHSRRP